MEDKIREVVDINFLYILWYIPILMEDKLPGEVVDINLLYILWYIPIFCTTSRF
jgi:hypothetical protein